MKYKCLIADDEELARELIKSYIEQLSYLDLIKVCENGAEVVNALREEEELHILFLDIQMPKLAGTEVVPLIKNHLPLVIFTTAYDHYALDAFDLNAVDYLLKPFGLDRFIKAVDKAIERVNSILGGSDDPASFIMVKSEYKLIRINIEDILYVEGYREYVRIYTVSNDVMTLDTMKNMETRLPGDKFCRIHKSYIVSTDRIASLQGNQVEIGTQKLPIGRSYKNQLLEQLNS